MPKPTATDRARRLIALLGRFQQQTRIPLADLADELGASQTEVANDLETLSMCGLAPYDPYELMPVMVDDGCVEVFGELPALKGPIRLSQSETRALVSALEAAGYADDDPLVTKLLGAASATMDVDELRNVLSATVGSHEISVYETIARGISAGRVVALKHTHDGADAVSRDIEPHRLFVERGNWYVTAWCRLADDWRTFRLDRISEPRLTDESFAVRAASEIPAATALPGSDLPKARLRFASADAFVDREWPGAVLVEQDALGGAIVEIPYAGTEWVARHVVARLGDVSVIAPDEVREAVVEIARSLG